MIHVNNFHELTENITASDIDSEHSLASNSNKKPLKKYYLLLYQKYQKKIILTIYQ